MMHTYSRSVITFSIFFLVLVLWDWYFERLSLHKYSIEKFNLLKTTIGNRSLRVSLLMSMHFRSCLFNNMHGHNTPISFIMFWKYNACAAWIIVDCPHTANCAISVGAVRYDEHAFLQRCHYCYIIASISVSRDHTQQTQRFAGQIVYIIIFRWYAISYLILRTIIFDHCCQWMCNF